jgi:GTPase SAR1 family protein
MSPSRSQEERWLSKARGRAGDSQVPDAAPGSVMSSRSVRSADPQESFQYAAGMMPNDARGFTPPSDYERAPRSNARYSHQPADSEVGLDRTPSPRLALLPASSPGLKIAVESSNLSPAARATLRIPDRPRTIPAAHVRLRSLLYPHTQRSDDMARDMIERFGNPVPMDEPVRKSYSRRPATVPSNHTPIVWDTPYDTDGSLDGAANRFFNRGNERLYEAYSQLHNMAQEFDKPFDSPAILVVGHQTDGKSALVEALMGFQFNHVGGGTKTRRPIAINMKYNATAVEPRCFLLKDDSYGREEEMSLPDLQRYIEAENQRLENDNGFWAKDIVVKIEYKYCPNLTIIDTPGLIAAAPGRKHMSTQHASRQVETLVRNKMTNKDYIILCLEDNSDWNNATTRRVVLDCDPELRRTVVVSTKFDTRIPQFSRAGDVEFFMKPPAKLLEPTLLGGGPFFTSVPSGRVGGSRDCLFRSNEHYREAVVQQEKRDTAELERRCDRRLHSSERSRVGVSQLRHFLERLLQQRYLENVPTIVPVLEREHRAASVKLRETDVELKNLDTDKLKEKGRAFYQHFLEKIPELLRGTMAAPPRVFGETLAHEHIRGGAFVGQDGRPVELAYLDVPNGEMRLFGGAQYHRALEEFRAIVGQVQCPVVSREDIINSCGVDEVHDGVNYTRTACVIAVARAKDTFEPYVHQLGFRLAHIARRLLPVAMYLLQKEGRILTGHEAFLKRIGSCFAKFVDQKVKACQDKCREDLASTTQFVTWSLHSGNKSGLKSVLAGREQEREEQRDRDRDMHPRDYDRRDPSAEYDDERYERESSRRESSRRDHDRERRGRGGARDPLDMNEDFIDYVDERDERRGRRDKHRRDEKKESREVAKRGGSADDKVVAGPIVDVGSKDMISLMDNTLWNRNMKDVTLDVVDMLVRQIYAGIRAYVVQSVELKFNCFFLMPLMNEFSGFLRQEMEMAFEENLDQVFDVRLVRMALEERQRKLESELEQMEHIQEKFAAIHNQLELQAQGSPATAAAQAAAAGKGSFQTIAEREIEASRAAMRASAEMAEEVRRANKEFAHHSPSKKSFGSPTRSGRVPLSSMSNSADLHGRV